MPVRCLLRPGFPYRTSWTRPLSAGWPRKLDRKHIDPAGSILTPIQPAGNKPPLFCIPGHTGVLLGFANLARLLSGQPIFGLSSPGIEEDGRPYRLEDLAAGFLRELRNVQPEGPYLLCGHCFGGWVAYEMACQLRAKGETVAMLAMLDCYHDIWVRDLPTAKLMPQKVRHLGRRTAYQLRTVARLGPSGGLRYFRERVEAAIETARERKDLREFHRYAREGRPLPARLRQSRFANQAAVNGYTPRPYRGAALLLGGSAPRAGMYPAPLMGWDGLLQGDVAVYSVPTDVRGLLAESAVDVVARHIARAMSTAFGDARELREGAAHVASR